jgi:hypothetical protein
MVTIRLSETSKYKKYEAIEKVGFKAVKEENGFRLIDLIYKNADKFIDNYYSSLDEILRLLSPYLMRIGILVAA